MCMCGIIYKYKVFLYETNLNLKISYILNHLQHMPRAIGPFKFSAFLKSSIIYTWPENCPFHKNIKFIYRKCIFKVGSFLFFSFFSVCNLIIFSHPHLYFYLNKIYLVQKVKFKRNAYLLLISFK